jgi:ABC-type uncharacterized transport system substrate-binding protein
MQPGKRSRLLMVTQVVFIAAALMNLTGIPYAGAQDHPTQKKILLIHSYHPEYPWVAGITRGVQKVLQDKDILLEIHYMDTKRNTSQEFKVQAGQKARELIDSWKPDVVIAADDNAQLFVTQHYVGKKPYFVFCGVNADPAEYGFPAPNVTGVIERPQFTASVELLKQITPNIRKLAVISDNDPTSVGTLNFMQQERPATKILGYNVIGDFETWKERVRGYNIDADALCIYMYHTIKEKGNQASLPPRQVMDWTIETSTIPTVGMFEFAIEDGVLCGVVESAEEHGLEAAQMALALIDGAAIESLPIKKANIGLRMVNLKTARKLGIQIPEDLLKTIDKTFE